MTNFRPKPPKYLSWSKLFLLESNEKYYIQRYYEGRDLKFLANEFGSAMAEALENDEENGDPLISQALMLMPKYPLREHELKAKNATGTPLLSKLDGLNLEGPDIGEYKSGKVKWTQAKVEKHDQLLFYAAIVYFAVGKVPRSVKLHWFSTAEESMGRVETFERKVSLADILRMSARQTRAWKRIKELDKQYKSGLI